MCLPGNRTERVLQKALCADLVVRGAGCGGTHLLVVRAWGLAAEPRGHFGNGPEFVVRMQDGQTVHMHMPRPPPSAWYRPPFDFFWPLVLVAVAVALATYPIIRKLKQRLEPLQNGVHK